MMTKILPLAVAALVLSAGGAFAEPPNSVVPNDHPGTGNHEPGQLADTDLAVFKGKGLRSAACTRVVQGAGLGLFGMASILRDPIGRGLGLGLFISARAICA